MTSKAIPATFHLPTAPGESLLIETTGLTGLRMIFAEKAALTAALDAAWEKRGIYLLFGPSPDGNPERYWVRVGKSSPGTLRKRVPWHIKNTEGWTHALVIHALVGLHSAQVGYLEGRFGDLLTNVPAAHLHGRQDHDDTLSDWEQEQLEPVVQIVCAVMRALGYPPTTTDQMAAMPLKSKSPKATSALTLRDVVEAGQLMPGAVLRPKSAAYTTTAIVEADGTLNVEGQSHPSLSAAAIAVTGHNTNGWRFWTAPSGDGTLVPLSTIREHVSNASLPKVELPDDPSGPLEVRNEEDSRKAEPEPSAASSGSPAAVLARMIRDGALPDGAALLAKYKGEEFRARVDGGGNVTVLTKDGSVRGTFASLSSAAREVVGGHTNGWTFWSLESAGSTGPRLAEVREDWKRRGNP